MRGCTVTYMRIVWDRPVYVPAFAFYFPSICFAVLTMLSAHSPYISSTFRAGPDLPNLSCTPIRRTRQGYSSLSSSHTAPPRPPDDAVFLGCENQAGFPRGLEYDFAVQGLDGGHVDHARMNACGAEFIGRLKRFGHHEPGGDDCDIVAVAQGIALADFHFYILRVDEGHRAAGRAAYRWGR